MTIFRWRWSILKAALSATQKEGCGGQGRDRAAKEGKRSFRQEKSQAPQCEKAYPLAQMGADGALHGDDSVAVRNSVCVTGGTRRLSVPEVVNTNLDAATARLESIGLSLEVAEKVYDDNTLPGTIVEQKPQQGTRSKRRNCFRRGVHGAGKRRRSRSGRHDAGGSRQRACTAGATRRRGDAPSGQRRPARHRHRAVSGTGRGARKRRHGRFDPQRPTVDARCPQCIGQNAGGDPAAAEGIRFAAGDVHYEYATGYDVGEVFRQSPESGTQLRQGIRSTSGWWRTSKWPLANIS